MAMNYAEKYSEKVDERFSKASITQNAFNNDYDWEGVSTVKVYSLSTAPLQNYQMNGTARYGTPDELGGNVQIMTLTQDKSFTFTIDRRAGEDRLMTMEAGRALRRQINEVIIPAVDKYRIQTLVDGAGCTKEGSPITGGHAYEAFLDGVTALLDNNAPLAGTFAFISPRFFKLIRLDDGFIKSSDLGQSMLLNGQVGMIESIPLILAPTSYFPTGVEFILSNRLAAASPVKLTEYKTHDNPPGINGWLCEGRVYYDAFVLDSKADAIYVHKSA